MESLHGLTTVHWDHEPGAVPRSTKSADKSDALQTLRALRRRPTVAKRLECVRLQRRFPKPGYDSMTGQVHGKPLGLMTEHWDHEPRAVLRRTESTDKSLIFTQKTNC